MKIKRMYCPHCGFLLAWHTIEEETVMGNRVIKCSSCEQNIIVPFCACQEAEYINFIRYESVLTDDDDTH